MIYTALDNFYLTKEQLEASPSRADGIDAATEAELRRYCCDVVAEAAVLLRLPQVVAATAQVLIQRFYCKRSLKKFDVKVRAGRPRACECLQQCFSLLLWHCLLLVPQLHVGHKGMPLAHAATRSSMTPPDPAPSCPRAGPTPAAGRGHGRLLAGLQAGGGDRD